MQTINRRESLKKLIDLGILGIGGIFGLKYIQETNKTISIESQNFISNPTDAITNSIFDSNIPKEILSLPLQYFSIPHEYANILQHKKQEKDLNFFIPLATNTYLDYTHYYLNMSMPHKNLPFLSYHYDSLQSFLKEIESQGFYMRNYTMNSINIQMIKELFILLEQDRIHKNIKSKNPNTQNNDTKTTTSAIDAYHTAMNYIDDIYMNCFNTNLKDNTPNLQKHREFLRALNIIGENNIKALYVGLGEKNNEVKNSNNSKTISKRKIVDDNAKEEKRPKFIGRLATTIIMKDGLYIG